jgi:hypothetical protein
MLKLAWAICYTWICFQNSPDYARQVDNEEQAEADVASDVEKERTRAYAKSCFAHQW